MTADAGRGRESADADACCAVQTRTNVIALRGIFVAVSRPKEDNGQASLVSAGQAHIPRKTLIDIKSSRERKLQCSIAGDRFTDLNETVARKFTDVYYRVCVHIYPHIWCIWMIKSIIPKRRNIDYCWTSATRRINYNTRFSNVYQQSPPIVESIGVLDFQRVYFTLYPVKHSQFLYFTMSEFSMWF